MSIDPRVRIKMADGTVCAVYKIKTGDEVMTGDGRVAKVASVDKVMLDDGSFEIIARGHGVLNVSPNHCIVTKRGNHMAQNLIPSELICDDNGGYGIMIVYRAVYDRDDTEAYDIKLEGADTLVAEGFIIGDSTKEGVRYSTLLEEYEDPEEAFMVTSEGEKYAVFEPDVADIMAWVEPPEKKPREEELYGRLNDKSGKTLEGESRETENERLMRYYRL